MHITFTVVNTPITLELITTRMTDAASVEEEVVDDFAIFPSSPPHVMRTTDPRFCPAGAASFSLYARGPRLWSTFSLGEAELLRTTVRRSAKKL